MGYFSNGTEGAMHEARYCSRGVGAYAQPVYIEVL